MSQVDEAAARPPEAAEELKGKKAELVEAEKYLRSAKNHWRNAQPEQQAESWQEADKAEVEVLRLRWEVAKAEKEAAKARGEGGTSLNDLQEDINVYREAYRQRLSGQLSAALFAFEVSSIIWLNLNVLELPGFFIAIYAREFLFQSLACLSP